MNLNCRRSLLLAEASGKMSIQGLADARRLTYLVVAGNHLLVHHIVPHHRLQRVDGTAIHLIGKVVVHSVDESGYELSLVAEIV